MRATEIITGFRALQVVAWFALDPLGCIEHFAKYHGRAVRIERKRSKPILVLIGPEYNREVLTATDRLRPTGIWPVRAPEGSAQANLRRNSLTTHGAEHRAFSGAVAPHLDRGKVETYFGQVRQIALAEIGGWPTGQRVNVRLLLQNLAQRYAFEVLFGIADDLQRRRFGDRLASYHAANWSRLAAVARFDLPGSPYRRVLRHAEMLQATTLELLSQSSGCAAHASVFRSIATSRSEAGMPLVAARAAGQTAGFALASYETTSTTLTWAMVLLSQHPQVMADLTAEIDAAGPIEDVTSAALVELPLLDAVLKETLRLMTPVPILGFKAVDDCRVAGFDAPEGTTLIISPHLTHRMPELYDQPDRFLPERWFAIRRTTYEYLPFSGGPRRCPGYLFAMINMRLALAVLLGRFETRLIDGQRIDRKYAAVNVPRGRVMAELSSRRSGMSTSRVAPRRRGNAFEMFLPAENNHGPAPAWTERTDCSAPS